MDRRRKGKGGRGERGEDWKGKEGRGGEKKKVEEHLRRKFGRVDLGSCLLMVDRFLIAVEGEGGEWEADEWSGDKNGELRRIKIRDNEVKEVQRGVEGEKKWQKKKKEISRGEDTDKERIGGEIGTQRTREG